jgi:hypothetical protein
MYRHQRQDEPLNGPAIEIARPKTKPYKGMRLTRSTISQVDRKASRADAKSPNACASFSSVAWLQLLRPSSNFVQVVICTHANRGLQTTALRLAAEALNAH